MSTKPQAPDTVAPPENTDIEALKSEHGSIRRSTINLTEPVKRAVTFIWRIPLVKDLAVYREETARNGEEAGLSRMLGSVVNHAGSCPRARRTERFAAGHRTILQP